MAVDTKHSFYKDMINRWNQIATVIAGSFAIKAATEKYLPKLSEQKETSYKAYLIRALFLEATGRTEETLVGLVFRKNPKIDANEAVKKDWLEHCTVDGNDIDTLARGVLKSLLEFARAGILVDLPREEDVADDETAVPWMSVYEAPTITNWRYGKDAAGLKELVQVVLKEDHEQHVDGGDEFEYEIVTKYRVLALVDVPTDDDIGARFYRVQLWHEVEDTTTKKKEWVIEWTTFPKILGRNLDYIPFCLIDLRDEIGQLKPPLESIAIVNISHYHTSADLEHGAHFTALPTPWVSGVDPGTKMTIGSEKAWVMEDPDAQAGMLEFTGQGLEALEKRMQAKQNQMAVLGARLLEEPKQAVEAADTHRIKKAGEESVLAKTTKVANTGINKALAIVTLFDSQLGKMILELNTDFDATVIDAQTLTVLMAGVQSARISYSTFFYNLQRGEYLPDDRTEEDEIELIQAETEVFADIAAKRLEAFGIDEKDKGGSSNTGDEDDDDDDEDDSASDEQ